MTVNLHVIRACVFTRTTNPPAFPTHEVVIRAVILPSL